MPHKHLQHLILLAVILFVSCNTQNETTIKQKELELKERELNLREQELKNNAALAEKPVAHQQTDTSSVIPESKPQVLAKYVFVFIKTKEPILQHMDAKYIAPLPGEIRGQTFDEINSVSYESYKYASTINEVKNFSENDGYQAADKFALVIQARLNSKKSDYITDVSMVSIKDRPALLRESFEIVEKKYFSFDTYKEASLFRDKLVKPID